MSGEPQAEASGGDLAQLARAVRQRLEVNRLFGWAVPLPRLRAPPGVPAPGPGAPPRRPGPPARPGPAVERRPPAASPARAGAGAGARMDPGAAAPADPRAAAPADPRAAEREAILAPMRAEVAACTRCGLCQTRTQTVFGVGDPTARLMFVGEAPGFDEDRQGEPFVGRAGRLLNDIIKAMGLRRDQVYIANVIKCRPPQNRVPNPAEVGACIGYLHRQLETIAPEVVVALGGVAAKALLGVESSMAKLRGRFHDYRGFPVMPTYHPAYLLRNPADKRKVWEDMQLVMQRLGLARPGPDTR